MSLLNDLADKPIFEANLNVSYSLFAFDKETRSEQEIRNDIHEKFGIQLVDPSTLKPDKFHQAYAHLLPEGFTFDPSKVQSIRVRCYDTETSFLVIPFEESNIQPFRFRVSQNRSEHDMIPPELLLSKESVKISA